MKLLQVCALSLFVLAPVTFAQRGGSHGGGGGGFRGGCGRGFWLGVGLRYWGYPYYGYGYYPYSYYPYYDYYYPQVAYTPSYSYYDSGPVVVNNNTPAPAPSRDYYAPSGPQTYRETIYLI